MTFSRDFPFGVTNWELPMAASAVSAAKSSTTKVSATKPAPSKVSGAKSTTTKVRGAKTATSKVHAATSHVQAGYASPSEVMATKPSGHGSGAREAAGELCPCLAICVVAPYVTREIVAGMKRVIVIEANIMMSPIKTAPLPVTEWPIETGAKAEHAVIRCTVTRPGGIVEWRRHLPGTIHTPWIIGWNIDFRCRRRNRHKVAVAGDSLLRRRFQCSGALRAMPHALD